MKDIYKKAANMVEFEKRMLENFEPFSDQYMLHAYGLAVLNDLLENAVE